MKPKVFLETSVISYLTALPSRDLIVAAHQQLTREWWNTRDRFDIFVSQAVLREARAGDPVAADRRLAAIRGIPVLDVTQEASDLAESLLRDGALPARAAIDALHVAVAVISGTDYLLTWNCTHLAHPRIRGIIEGLCRNAGLEPPAICTPEELLEE